MIQVSNAAYRALLAPEVRIKTEIVWRLTRSTGGIDISDRARVAPVNYQISPFLGGMGRVATSVTIDNSDGAFTTGANASFLVGGPDAYVNTEIRVRQGPVLPDGTVEYIDVFTGRVDDIEWDIGTLEVKVLGILETLAETPLPETFVFGAQAGLSGELYYALKETMVAMLAYTPFAAADIDTTSTGFAQCNDWLLHCGWLVTGQIPQRTSVGVAMEELARSWLGHLVQTEAGKIGVIPGVLPREFGVSLEGIDVPDLLEDPLAHEFALREDKREAATEVIVEYAGTTISRRDSTVEAAGIGRKTKYVSMQYCRLGAQAAWTAAILLQQNRPWPKTLTCSCPGYGLLIQVGDRCHVKDSITGVTRNLQVMAKRWEQEGNIALLLRERKDDATVWNKDMAHWGVESWGADLL